MIIKPLQNCNYEYMYICTYTRIKLCRAATTAKDNPPIHNLHSRRSPIGLPICKKMFCSRKLE